MDKVLSKDGVQIRLTSERWAHITSGHPEIGDYYYEILEVIGSPDIIYKGNNDAKIAVKPLPKSFDKFIVVVYKELNAFDGFVITAHFTNKLQKLNNNKILWERPQS